MVAAMNSVGVDGAIMVSSFSAYEYIRSTRSKSTTPIRISFGLTPVDATIPAIDDVAAKWAGSPT
jgi:L-fuconolactonase